MNTATPISSAALATAVNTSARCHPYVREGDELPRLASITAASPMNTATTSVSMCPASANRAIELITSEVVSSTTKNVARIPAATIIRGIIRDAEAGSEASAGL
ncbi:Uncharacterised protein [Mycobacterium tuberculosis]|nr:Uncharacterised protein [Mycobacterium tuberculosis]